MKKERKEIKKKKKEKKRRKKETTNNVKLLHIKCCFLQLFNSPVALKKKQEKVEITPLYMYLSILSRTVFIPCFNLLNCHVSRVNK